MDKNYGEMKIKGGDMEQKGASESGKQGKIEGFGGSAPSKSTNECEPKKPGGPIEGFSSGYISGKI
jgi:hypothetical protein